jgi:hypothetical protein
MFNIVVIRFGTCGRLRIAAQGEHFTNATRAADDDGFNRFERHARAVAAVAVAGT